MRHRCRILPAVLTAALSSVVSIVSAWTTLTGHIGGISDGDTITLLDGTKTQHTIRMDAIDAPEKGRLFGNRSKQSLSDLAFGRDAQAHCPKVDRYNRRVCMLIVGGVDVGLEQIKRGMAWVFTRYLKELEPDRREAYVAAEVEAREAKRGLWKDAQPTAPWDWRAAKRQ